ncbi:hypothetical protein H4S08_004048 [Coemansia sp. RSA 1365]|nr:hypothetical protein H4S08_004048 [Coemansia sp. RSA 1365]
MTASDIDRLWVGAHFKPVFDPVLHPALALLFSAIGLVYAGKFTVTRGDLGREATFAVISSLALGLAVVMGAQACGLYL